MEVNGQFYTTDVLSPGKSPHYPGRGLELAFCNRVEHLILMDPCIIDYSVEIPTRCSFVIEFIIPKLFKGSTCFERHTAHHQEL